MPGADRISFRKIRVKRQRAAPRLDRLGGFKVQVDKFGAGKRRTHDMHVIGGRQQHIDGRCPMKTATGTVLDVEHKVAAAIRAVADKGAASGAVVVYMDSGNVDTVVAKTIEINASEIVVTHS